MCNVELEGMPFDERVESGDDRCLPACMRRRSEGRVLVRRARRVRRVEMDVLRGRVRGIVFRPEMSLTKICMVSSSEVLELMLEMLELRRMVAVTFAVCYDVFAVESVCRVAVAVAVAVVVVVMCVCAMTEQTDRRRWSVVEGVELGCCR